VQRIVRPQAMKVMDAILLAHVLCCRVGCYIDRLPEKSPRFPMARTASIEGLATHKAYHKGVSLAVRLSQTQRPSDLEDGLRQPPLVLS
jgi:hypothetical protein